MALSMEHRRRGDDQGSKSRPDETITMIYSRLGFAPEFRTRARRRRPGQRASGKGLRFHSLVRTPTPPPCHPLFVSTRPWKRKGSASTAWRADQKGALVRFGRRSGPHGGADRPRFCRHRSQQARSCGAERACAAGLGCPLRATTAAGRSRPRRRPLAGSPSCSGRSAGRASRRGRSRGSADRCRGFHA